MHEELRTIRIKTKDLNAYIKTKNSWKKTKISESTQKVISLFKIHHKIKELIDKKDPRFLKGMIKDNKCMGARLNILPNGIKLNQAYSLFAKNLTIHDESSHDHWDVIYQNPNGKFAYIYTLEKKIKSKNIKYKKVKEFEKVFPKLQEQVKKALSNKKDILALPMFTLLNTYMRVGNEIYYKEHHHKGLTTLKKKDIKINKNNVIFNYIAKDGVPMIISKDFPELYILRLKDQLKKLNSKSFIFTDAKGNPLKETHFKEAFKRYCGKEFYPHIVRSYYATKSIENFLKNKPNKLELKEKLQKIAKNLGHKKFSKKHHEWENSYTTTLSHYIEPKLAERVKEFIKK